MGVFGDGGAIGPLAVIPGAATAAAVIVVIVVIIVVVVVEWIVVVVEWLVAVVGAHDIEKPVIHIGCGDRVVAFRRSIVVTVRVIELFLIQDFPASHGTGSLVVRHRVRGHVEYFVVRDLVGVVVPEWG